MHSFSHLFITFFLALSLISCGGSGQTDSNPPAITGGDSNPNTATIAGEIDSHYIQPTGQNKVILKQQDTTISTTTVTQSLSDYSWHYEFSNVNYGNYKLVFVATPESGPSTEHEYNLAVDSDSESWNLEPDNIIKVGQNRIYSTPSEAYPYVSDGDVIEIDAGTYTNDRVVWRQNNITLRGVNGRAHITSPEAINYASGNDSMNGKAIWVTSGDNIRIENIEFSQAHTVIDIEPNTHNGAGIRQEGNNLYISNCYFHDNENGILGGNGTTLIEFSEFSLNGYGQGYTHNIYISRGDRLIARYNYLHHAKIGHQLKSRAAENIVIYNRIMDESTGTASYEIDLPNGGNSIVMGNLIHKGVNNDNSTMVSFGREGLTHPINKLVVTNNSFVSDDNYTTFVNAQNGSTLYLGNNLFIGTGTITNLTATELSNIHTTTDPGLTDITNYDYSLTSSASSLINAGSNILETSLVDTTPDKEYIHPRSYQTRDTNSSVDIGAYSW